MWLPPLTFLNLHYAYIISFALLGAVIIGPAGNMKAIDAFFFGASACTESGLNTVDVKEMFTYQQLAIYFIPIFTNLGFINILIVLVRLYWFRREMGAISSQKPEGAQEPVSDHSVPAPVATKVDAGARQRTIHFSAETRDSKKDATTIYVPGPRERDLGGDFIEIEPRQDPEGLSGEREHRPSLSGLPKLKSVLSGHRDTTDNRSLPGLSSYATLGRNSSFHHLTEDDKDLLGGIEYKALKVLLKITTAYFFGLHLFGAICLLPWIHNASAKYTDVLDAAGQDKTWWAFYSAQTMVNNLGFTLTPDSMISFRDATWPMLVMTFLAFAGNTCYPVLLRLCLWITLKLTPSSSASRKPLQFLLDHPRRCCTMLFPSLPTWILFGIVVLLNFVDTLLIIVLDLDSPEVASLAPGPRVLAALFQAASSRHTGTATFNLANVNPAVQFSLLIMMYIAVFPIAISIRASNTYEERSLGIYGAKNEYDENRGRNYVLAHMKNQLGYDLWYIGIGVFCITIAESAKIKDMSNPAFNVFAVLFEVTSAYGNVGLSLGHPSVATSLAGRFSNFGKVVICAMMIRGRHRMLPSNIDRAVSLPLKTSTGDGMSRSATWDVEKDTTTSLKRHHTR